MLEVRVHGTPLNLGLGGDGASSEHKVGVGRGQEVNSHGVMWLEN